MLCDYADWQRFLAVITETVSSCKPPGVTQNTDVIHPFTWPCPYPVRIVVFLCSPLASLGMVTCPLAVVVWYCCS